MFYLNFDYSISATISSDFVKYSNKGIIHDITII